MMFSAVKPDGFGGNDRQARFLDRGAGAKTMKLAADAPWGRPPVIDAMVSTEAAAMKLRRVMPLPFCNSPF
jgi:hypothetical protein